MTRDELIEAGYTALEEAARRLEKDSLVGVVIDAVELLILADLRTKVETLIAPQGYGSWNSALEAVLALIDGANDAQDRDPGNDRRRVRIATVTRRADGLDRQHETPGASTGTGGPIAQPNGGIEP